jgi:hypothetical protein
MKMRCNIKSYQNIHPSKERTSRYLRVTGPGHYLILDSINPEKAEILSKKGYERSDLNMP